MTEYIAKDTYTGKWAITLNNKKHRVSVFTARQIAAFAGEGEGAVFESFGYVGGRESFGRTRYVADAEGNLHCYDSDGVRKIIHPADRKLRILVNK